MKLIDKRELMELLDDMFSRYDGTPSVMEGFKYGIDAVISEVSVMPTIDAEPIKHGKWIGKPIGGYSTVRCSVCGDVFLENNGKWKYCPSCGVLMDASKYEELEINPCRGCEDYDGKGGCLSNGGCANVNEVKDEDAD